VPNSKELRQLSTALASQENLRGYFVYRWLDDLIQKVTWLLTSIWCKPSYKVQKWQVLTGEKKKKVKLGVWVKKCPVGGKAASAEKNKIGRERRKKYGYTLNLVSTTEELLGKKSRIRPLGILCADYTTPLYIPKLALTLPTSGDRSVGIVRSRTQAMEFVIFLFCN
jgi:hypothetical protein